LGRYEFAPCNPPSSITKPGGRKDELYFSSTTVTDTTRRRV
jgi:hypothetical protein